MTPHAAEPVPQPVPELVQSVGGPKRWYHTIDLPDGTKTPGFFDTRAAPAHVPFPSEVAGGRCLDVGTFDGFWSFEMERRGASEVVAVDVDDPAKLDWKFGEAANGIADIREIGAYGGKGFAAAAAVTGSSARLEYCSVYDLSPSRFGMFDVVLCGALILHLRDPVRALERMRSVCRGKLVLIETLDDRLEWISRWVAAAAFHPVYQMWWRANSSGFRGMLAAAGFDLVEQGPRFVVPFGAGGPPTKGSRLAGLAARHPGKRGMLARAFIAEPSDEAR